MALTRAVFLCAVAAAIVVVAHAAAPSSPNARCEDAIPEKAASIFGDGIEASLSFEGFVDFATDGGKEIDTTDGGALADCMGKFGLGANRFTSFHSIRPDGDYMYSIGFCSRDAADGKLQVVVYEADSCDDTPKCVPGLDVTGDCGGAVLFRARRGVRYFVVVINGEADPTKVTRPYSLDVHRYECSDSGSLRCDTDGTAIACDDGYVKFFDNDVPRCVQDVSISRVGNAPIEGQSFTMQANAGGNVLNEPILASEITWYFRHERDAEVTQLTDHPITKSPTNSPPVSLMTSGAGPLQKQQLVIDRAFSNWRKYFFSAKVERGGKTYWSPEFQVTLSTLRAFPVESIDNILNGKTVSEYWHPTNNWPAFERYVYSVNIAGATGTRVYLTAPVYTENSGSMTVKRNAVPTAVATTVVKDIGNQWFTVICDHVILKFDGSSYSDAATRKTHIQTTLETALKALMDDGKTTPAPFGVSVYITSSVPAITSGPYEVNLYAMNYRTGKPIALADIVTAINWNGNAASAGSTSIFTAATVGKLTTGTTTTGPTFCTLLCSDNSYVTTRTDTNGFVAVAPADTLNLGSRWSIEAADGEVKLDAPYQSRVVLKSLNTGAAAFTNKYVAANIVLSSDFTTVQSSTFSYVAAKADALVFEITNAATYFLFTSDPSKTMQYTSTKCPPRSFGKSATDISTPSQCASTSVFPANDPTYRRYEIDLGGEFSLNGFAAATAYYTLADTTKTSQRPFRIAAKLKAEDAYTSLTTAIGADEGTRCRSFIPSPCRDAPISANIIGYTRSKTFPGGVRDGMLGWRYLRIEFDTMLANIAKVAIDQRFFIFERVTVDGMCPCNGHSGACDPSNGYCALSVGNGDGENLAFTDTTSLGENYPAQSKGKDALVNCQHRTAGIKCDVCEVGFYASSPVINHGFPDVTYDQIGNPSIPVVTPEEIRNLQFFYYDFDLTPAQTNRYMVPDDSDDGVNGFSEVYKLFFGNGEVCRVCECNGHARSEWDPNVSPSLTDPCDVETGVCDCHPDTNTEGDHCETCMDNYCRPLCYDDSDPSCFRSACYECMCNKHSIGYDAGANQDRCEKMGCGCACDPTHNVDGAFCQNCKYGYHSDDGTGLDGKVCSACACNGHKKFAALGEVPDGVDDLAESCNAVAGHCMQNWYGEKEACLDNTFGSSCQYCLPDYYRPYLAGTTNISPRDSCTSCQCGPSAEGRALADRGYGWEDGKLATCDPEGGQCFCDAAKNVKLNEELNKCECKVGFWRTPAEEANGDPCKPCNCNSHKDDDFCNPTTGNCDDESKLFGGLCKDNTRGEKCELCIDGFFRATGDPLSAGCVPCDCTGNGDKLQSGEDTCNPVGGACNCKGCTTGAKCDECGTSCFSQPTRANGDKLVKGVHVCKACRTDSCNGWSDTCDKWSSVCSNCDATSNTGGDHCDTCKDGYKRDLSKVAFLGATKPWDYTFTDADNAVLLKTTCVLCQCNTHSTKCDAKTGECSACGDNTENDKSATGTARCDKCKDNYFRNSEGYNPFSSCDLYGQSPPSPKTAQDVTKACVACSQHCFLAGAGATCTKSNGKCTNCPTGATGDRCERCTPGYYGEPSKGIPCRKCECYGHESPVNVGRNAGKNKENKISPLQLCEHGADATLTNVCFLEYLSMGAGPGSDAEKAKTDASVALKYVRCACEQETTDKVTNWKTGLLINDESKYTGRQCTSCNAKRYYGIPTTPLGAGGYDVCHDCVCYSNINLYGTSDNCVTSLLSPKCQNCLGQTTGDDCGTCKDGWYGNPKRQDRAVLDGSGNPNKCFKCDCNGQSKTRVGVALGIAGDTCIGVGANPNPGDYKCGECRPGYTGDGCDQCAIGYQKSTANALGDGRKDNLYVVCTQCDSCTTDLLNGKLVPNQPILNAVYDGVATLNASVLTYIGLDGSILNGKLTDARDAATDAVTKSHEALNAANLLDTAIDQLKSDQETTIGNIQTQFNTAKHNIAGEADADSLAIIALTTAIGALEAEWSGIAGDIGDAKTAIDGFYDDVTAMWETQKGLEGDINDFVTGRLKALKDGYVVNTALIGNPNHARREVPNGGDGQSLAERMRAAEDDLDDVVGRESDGVNAVEDELKDIASLHNMLSEQLDALANITARLAAQNDQIGTLHDVISNEVTEALLDLDGSLDEIDGRLSQLENLATPCGQNPCGTRLCRNTGGGQYECYCNDDEFDTGSECIKIMDHCHDEGGAAVCKNGAICTNSLMGYECSCTLGYRGDDCATAFRPCDSSPCAHGTCSKDKNDAEGFVCTGCPPYYTGPRCQFRQAFAFTGTQWIGYAAPTAFTAAVGFSVKFSFMTEASTGTLFGTFRQGSFQDHIAVYLYAGRLTFSFAPGAYSACNEDYTSCPGATVWRTADKVNDGDEYTVMITVAANLVTISLTDDDGAHVAGSPKSLDLITKPGAAGTIDLTGPLYFGRFNPTTNNQFIPRALSSNPGFVGHMWGVWLSGTPRTLNAAVGGAVTDVSSPPAALETIGNGNMLVFAGGAYARFLPRTLGDVFALSMWFSASSDGILFASASEDGKDYAVLEVADGKLSFSWSCGGEGHKITGPSVVDMGAIKVVVEKAVQTTASGVGSKVTLTASGALSAQSAVDANGPLVSIDNMESIWLGGAPEEVAGSSTNRGIQGRVWAFAISGMAVPFGTAVEVGEGTFYATH